MGDPLMRDPKLVCEDVADEYVSVERALIDYGVVIRVVDRDLAQYEVDEDTTEKERARIAAARPGWLDEDAESVAMRYRAGELNVMDCVRQYGVILDWGNGQLLATTTQQFRGMMKRRVAPYWGKTLAILSLEAKDRVKIAA